MEQRLLGPLLTVTREWIRRGQSRGRIDAASDPGVLVDILYGPLFYRWLLRTGPLDTAYLEALTASVLRVFTPDGQRPAR